MKKHPAGEYKATCKGCGKEVVFQYHCHAKDFKYCSHTCYVSHFGSSMADRLNRKRPKAVLLEINAVCEWCKKEFSYIGNLAKSKNRFCSRLCINQFANGKRRWVPEEDDILKKEYERTILLKELEIKLGRSRQELKNRASFLGLVRDEKIRKLALSTGGKKNKGRKRPDLIKNGYRGSGPDNPFYGKKHTTETREIISKSQKEKTAFKRLNQDPQFQEKRKAALVEALKDPEVQKRRFMGLLQSKNCPNATERKLDFIIQEMFPGEYKFTGDGSFIIAGLNPDWTNINGQKKVIELFGEHVHDPAQAFCKVSEKATEPGRKKVFAEYGYETLVVWCKDMKNAKKLRRKLLLFHLD